MSDLTRRDFVQQASLFAGGLIVVPPLQTSRTLSFRADAADVSLGNDLITARWRLTGGVLRGLSLVDLGSHRTLDLPVEVVTLVLQDGSTILGSELAARAPVYERLPGDHRAARFADRLPGHQVTVELTDPASRVAVSWRAILRTDSRYLRQEVTVRALGGDLPVKEIRLGDLTLPEARILGSVAGSPVVTSGWFLGFEHPLALHTVADGRVRYGLARELPLRPGAPVTCSSVVGAVTPGQLRRDFLLYLERERAHPYRPFLHYNSWYDLGYFNKYDEAGALGVIDAFGVELHRKRGVTLDSFLFDDGWDDPETLWHFHAGFPHGFKAIRAAAGKYGAAPGVWMSPWGGYGKPRDERVTYGKTQGFETNEGGFELSGPKYYQRFHEVCLDMMRTYGVNQFKFDGTGNVSHVFPGSLFDSDFDAMLALIADLRTEKPDLYVNLTTGTYPSPFFLRSCDSIWRGGEDHEFAGVGSWRQKWITYRDADTYAGIVQKGPLFPLNSLMLHGMIYARHAHNLDTDPGGDFESEARAYFGTGTQLQEMYLTPSLLSAQNWDVLAEAARWSRSRAPVLADTHWVGGDPAKLEPYGHAAWTPARGILSLRNPSDKPQTFPLKVAEALELPDHAPQRVMFRHALRSERARPSIDATADQTVEIPLAPFEVLTLETV
ncbi:MAG TPA: enterotoxin [Gemmatimonadales bacterium]|jgi:hypothetical protein|nr:enterotoxin [Gemmatimonadales bacterium]